MTSVKAKDQMFGLSKRERQIMHVVYSEGAVTAADVQRLMPEPPSYSTVRALLSALETKGQLRHEHDGPRYVFIPTVAKEDARSSALRHLLDTFFDSSPSLAMTALLELEGGETIDPDQLHRLQELVESARRMEVD